MKHHLLKLVASLASLAVVTAVAAGCDSDDAKKKNGTSSPDGPATGEPAKAAAAVFLRPRVEGDRAVVDVVARGAARVVHGAAFRLHWDPAKLTFVEARASDAWSASAIRLAKEGLPGELVVAWTEKNATAGLDASDETVLGTLDFTMTTRDGVAVDFRPDRSTLRDATGTSLETVWRGVQLAPR